MDGLDKDPVRIEIVSARLEQQPVLANLLELYARDFSEFHEIPLGPDGRFVYDKLPLYWTEPDRHPFLAMVDGNVAGFVLVKRGSEISGDRDVWDVAEFFVLHGYRRRGVGSEIAQQIWRQFPGRWEVRVMEANQPAVRFWDTAITKFVGKAISTVRVKRDGKIWHLFSFTSVGRAK